MHSAYSNPIIFDERVLNLPLIILLWNNQGSGEIRNYMLENNIQPEGVDLAASDFIRIAHAYDLPAVSVTQKSEIISHLKGAVDNKQSLLIEVQTN